MGLGEIEGVRELVHFPSLAKEKQKPRDLPKDTCSFEAEPEPKIQFFPLQVCH